MNWVLAVAFCVILVETIIRLPFLKPLTDLNRYSRRAMAVLTSKYASDHWKEKAMGAYAKATFKATINLATLLIIVLVFAAILVIGLDQISSGFQSFVLDWKGLGLTVVVAALYIPIRKAIFRE